VDIVSILQTGIEIEDDKNRYNSNDNDSAYETSCKEQAIYFLICDSCHWCASCISVNAPLRCPSCDDSKVEWIPITNGEIHRFDYDRKPGY
jgi:rubrerythrin